MSSETEMKTCRKCHKEKPMEEFTRQKYKSKKKGTYWIYGRECKKCALVDKKIKYHTDEETRRKYNERAKAKAKEKKRCEEEKREKNQNMIDRIKYLFQHQVHKFPHDSKERVELNKKIMEVLNCPKPLTWQPILPRNSEPVHVFDLFDLLEKTK